MSYIFLLGAGASVEAGLPTANQLTDKVLQYFEDGRKGVYPVLRYTLAGLMFEDSKKQSSERRATTIDVERLLNVVHILSQRNDLDLDPFIGSWESSLESLDYPRPNVQFYGDREVRNFIEKLSSHINDTGNRRSRSSGFLDHDFTKAVQSITGRPRGKSHFSVAVKESTSCLKSLLHVEESQSLEYLNPLQAFAARSLLVSVATLNYDKVFESFCTKLGISYSIGVENWSKKFEVLPPQRGVFLMKLHGSLNWRYQKRTPELSTVEEFNVIPWNEPDGGQPAIIFGQRDKLTTDGPFLDLLRAFRDQLFKSSHLIVIGYSFRDTHINNYIKYWFSRTENRKLTVIDPGVNESMLPQEIRKQYTQTLMGNPTLHATSSDKPESNEVKKRILGIKMMKMGAGEGLAELAREEGLA